MLKTSRCEGNNCKNKARFFVSQSTIPQRLGNGETETAPAARSNLSCGTHLRFFIETLGKLSFRTNDSVRVTIL